MKQPSAFTLIMMLALATPAAAGNSLQFGGYVAANSRSTDSRAMARAAIDLRNLLEKGDKFALVRIRKSEVQNVSGKNFKFCLSVKAGKKRADVETIVYRDLSGRIMLMRWHEGHC